MKKKKTIIPIIITLLLVITLGTTYAFFEYLRVGDEKSVLVTGDIYMHYTESAGFLFENALPISKEKGLEQTNNIFNFTITGKNTSSKDIYYGVSIVIDETPEGKTPIDPSNVVFYLTSGEDILIDAIRYNNFDNPIYVATIPKNTNNETTKNYTLRAWLTEDIRISETDEGADYTMDEWNNSYLSFKVKVEGTMDKMNMPLTIEHDDTSIQNNKQYFIATVSNYLNPEEAGEMLETNDEITLEVTSDSSNIEFTYKDSLNNVTAASDSLTLNYTFDKKQSEEIQVFVTPKNDSNTDADINVKLTKNNIEVYDQVINMNIKGNNYCLNNGFTKLSDCLLVSENQSASVEFAKEQITAKGEANINYTAPTYKYVQKTTNNIVNPGVPVSAGYKYYVAEGYTPINENTGIFTLTNYTEKDSLTADDVGKYTTGTTNNGATNSTIYKILEVVDGVVTKADIITYEITSTLRSEVGLYKTVDDYGDTYFFRGDVENNNVYFAGFYWKVVRINGDGGIRLIYAGTNPEMEVNLDSVNGTTYPYNSRYVNPTYVGYMYGEDDSDLEVDESAETTYYGIVANRKYYFADDFTKDDTTKTFKLSGNIIPEAKTVAEMNALGSEGFAKYPYTCMVIDSTSSCQVLINIKGYVSETKVRATYLTYGSADLDVTKLNNKDSDIKKILDTWYETNIKNLSDENGKLLENYLVDGSFCNDRSFAESNVGNGFSIIPSTLYRGYKTFDTDSNKTATLTCSTVDKFSKTNAYGNAKLEHPTALITADEVVLAGGKFNEKNENYYLRTNGNFWTMTPSYFNESYVNAFIFSVLTTGELSNRSFANTLGARAVINLSPNVLISEGDGTVDNPFKLKLA